MARNIYPCMGHYEMAMILKLRDRVAKDLEYLGKAKVEASYMIQENIQELLKKKKIVR